MAPPPIPRHPTPPPVVAAAAAQSSAEMEVMTQQKPGMTKTNPEKPSNLGQEEL